MHKKKILNSQEIIPLNKRKAITKEAKPRKYTKILEAINAFLEWLYTLKLKNI